MRWSAVFLVSMVALVLLPTAELTVRPGPVGEHEKGRCFSSIQAAVMAARPGDAVIIARAFARNPIVGLRPALSLLLSGA